MSELRQATYEHVVTTALSFSCTRHLRELHLRWKSIGTLCKYAMGSIWDRVEEKNELGGEIRIGGSRVKVVRSPEAKIQYLEDSQPNEVSIE